MVAWLQQECALVLTFPKLGAGAPHSLRAKPPVLRDCAYSLQVAAHAQRQACLHTMPLRPLTLDNHGSLEHHHALATWLYEGRPTQRHSATHPKSNTWADGPSSWPVLKHAPLREAQALPAAASAHMPSAATAPALAGPDDGAAMSGDAGDRARPGLPTEPMLSPLPSHAPSSRCGVRTTITAYSADSQRCTCCASSRSARTTSCLAEMWHRRRSLRCAETRLSARNSLPRHMASKALILASGFI